MTDIKKSKDDLIGEYEKELLRLKQIVAIGENLERKLFESEQRFRNLLEVVPDIIYQISPDGNFRYISESIRSLGYDPTELIGKHFSKIIHPDEIDYISRRSVLPNYEGKVTGSELAPKLFDERRTGKRITRYLEVRLIPKGYKKGDDDLIKYARVYSSGEVASSGEYISSKEKGVEFLGTIGVIRDISERKRVDEEIKKKQRFESIGILSGGIAHDFNNILAAIIGNISLAQMELGSTSEVSKVLKEAEKAVSRAKDLTDKLLSFSAGSSRVRNAISIDEFLEQTVESYLKAYKIVFNLNIAENLRDVYVDADHLKNVIENFLLNSVEAMRNDGLIEVKAENITFDSKYHDLAPGNYVKIVIKDNGVGISDEDVSRVFEPYYTTKQNGNGFGLSIAYSIIQKHNGFVSLKSEPGGGTSVFIYLPASDEPVKKSANGKRNGTFRKGRVLLMDDEPDVLAITKEMLQNSGYYVVITKDGGEAVDIFRKAFKGDNRFDIVILDLTVPGGLGAGDAIKKIREVDPSVKAVVSSGYTNDPVMENFREHGFNGAMEKPYHMDNLLSVLEEVLE
ncbi:ATP-binding protein [Spirochaetota bacterium]